MWMGYVWNPRCQATRLHCQLRMAQTPNSNRSSFLWSNRWLHESLKYWIRCYPCNCSKVGFKISQFLLRKRAENFELWSDTFMIMVLEAAWLEDSRSAEDYPTLKVSQQMKMALLLDRVANKTRVTRVREYWYRPFIHHIGIWYMIQVIRTKLTRMKIGLTSYQLNVKMVAPSSGSTDPTLALVPTASGRFSKWYSDRGLFTQNGA